MPSSPCPHASTHTRINPQPKSTHNPNQPRPSKPTQTKTNPHHKFRLNHHRDLPTSPLSIIDPNSHRHHRDHATRHAPISLCCELRWHALNERERCERGRENWGWNDVVGFLWEKERVHSAWEKGRWELGREEREKTIKKLNTHATVPV